MERGGIRVWQDGVSPAKAFGSLLMQTLPSPLAQAPPPSCLPAAQPSPLAPAPWPACPPAPKGLRMGAEWQRECIVMHSCSPCGPTRGHALLGVVLLLVLRAARNRMQMHTAATRLQGGSESTTSMHLARARARPLSLGQCLPDSRRCRAWSRPAAHGDANNGVAGSGGAKKGNK